MLCSVCQSIDFHDANRPPHPGNGGAKHHPTFQALAEAANNGCELCSLIKSKAPEESSETKPQEGSIFCNLWNWYDGPEEEYRGSATVLFYEEKSRWSVALGIFADSGSPPAIMNLISGRTMQLTADSEICFELSAKWLRNCISNHESSCPHDPAAKLPTRVLDVGSDLDSDQIKVLETKGLDGVWVALSHCWGRIARYVLETTNLQQMTCGISLSEVPKTFLDAVIITRRLGFRYLWIDSLCILQDSAEDWAFESRQMQDYYSKSILTIASDLAYGDHESFLDNIREPRSLIKVPFTEKTGTISSYVYMFENLNIQNLEPVQTPLNVRGWTLQEDVLSPRTLHFKSTEVVFECQRSTFSETDMTPQGYTDNDTMRSIKRFFLRPESGFDDPVLVKYPHFMNYYQPIKRWYRLFEEYCTRLLTFESDRLAAIAGLAKEIQRQTSYSYKAGIWLEDIHRGLLWAVNGRGEKPEKYRAPSWSWAALDMNFYWGNSLNPNFQMYMSGLWSDQDDGCVAKILDCEVQTVNGDPFSEVVSGQLRIRGHILPLSEWQRESAPFINVFWRHAEYHQSPFTDGGTRRPMAADQLILNFDVTPKDINDSTSVDSDSTESISDGEESNNEVEPELENYPTDIILLQIKRIVIGKTKDGNTRAIFSCLLLAPLAQDGSQIGFNRVGTAEVPEINGLGSDGWTEQEITIF